MVRAYAEVRYKAGSWTRERRAVARIEAIRLGLDVRFVVTTVERGSSEWIYDSQNSRPRPTETLIKLPKS